MTFYPICMSVFVKLYLEIILFLPFLCENYSAEQANRHNFVMYMMSPTGCCPISTNSIVHKTVWSHHDNTNHYPIIQTKMVSEIFSLLQKVAHNDGWNSKWVWSQWISSSCCVGALGTCGVHSPQHKKVNIRIRDGELWPIVTQTVTNGTYQSNSRGDCRVRCSNRHILTSFFSFVRQQYIFALLQKGILIDIYTEN